MLDHQAPRELRQRGGERRTSRELTLVTDGEIVARFDSLALDEEERPYLANQAPRFRCLLERIDAVRRELGYETSGRGLRLLDIGPSFQTQLLRDRYPEAEVTTLGLEPSAVSTARPGERHVDFDLNDAFRPGGWPRLEPFPLIVFAEVIEHLYTSPSQVLRCVATWLAPEGVMIVQTPNAVALRKRAWVLAGRNPYHLIRESRRNPGHFREYTQAELEQAASAAGLVATEVWHDNYFGGRGFWPHFYRLTRGVLPSALRQGLTVQMRHPDGGS